MVPQWEVLRYSDGLLSQADNTEDPRNCLGLSRKELLVFPVCRWGNNSACLATLRSGSKARGGQSPGGAWTESGTQVAVVEAGEQQDPISFLGAWPCPSLCRLPRALQ